MSDADAASIETARLRASYIRGELSGDEFEAALRELLPRPAQPAPVTGTAVVAGRTPAATASGAVSSRATGRPPRRSFEEWLDDTTSTAKDIARGLGMFAAVWLVGLAMTLAIALLIWAAVSLGLIHDNGGDGSPSQCDVVPSSCGE